jgi:anti-sigma factor RsiW
MKTRKDPPWGLINAYLDGELPPRKQEAVAKLLARHPEWHDQVEELRQIIETTRTLRIKEPNPSVWDHYWEEIDSRLPRQFSWILMAAGAVLLILLGFAKIISLLAAQDNPLWLVAFVSILTGFVVLFFLVLRSRLIEIPRDRYRKIRK